MPRQASTSRAVELPQTSLFPPRRKMEETSDLPLYNRNSGISKKEISRSRFAEKLVHVIPVVVLLGLFILWWYSYPVNLEGKNGRTTADFQLMMQNSTLFNLTFPPYPSISKMQMV